MSQTVAQKIAQDEVIQASFQTIQERYANLQSTLTGIRPPQAERAQSYDETIAEFKALRGVDLFFPYLSSGAGHGPLVELADGSVKYDYTCGIGVHILGHGHPALLRANLESALEDVTMQGNLQQNENSLKLTRKLLSLAQKNGAKLDHCFLSSSGVMAGENALKMAFQKNHPASRVLAFKRCFAGRSLAFSQINDKPAFREGLPEIIDVDYVPFFDADHPEESTQAALDTLKKHLADHPGQHAAMIFELIQGEGGFHLGSAKFHRALMELCQEHHIAVLADEVQTFARTQSPFAFQHYGLDDLIDIVWIGKASQVCATFFSKKYQPRPGLVAQTYTASTATISASLAVLNELETGRYFGPDGKTAKLHTFFVNQLEALAVRHPTLLSGPYGHGAMTGCTPYGGDGAAVVRLVHHLYENGIIAFLAGANPTRLRFLLPIGALTEAHILETIPVLEKSLLAVAKELNLS